MVYYIDTNRSFVRVLPKLIFRDARKCTPLILATVSENKSFIST